MKKKHYIKPQTGIITIGGKALCIWDGDVPIATGSSADTTTPEESDAKEIDFTDEETWGNPWED